VWQANTLQNGARTGIMRCLKRVNLDGVRATSGGDAVGQLSGAGPVDPPTGKSIATDYVYAMEFDDGRIRHMTKIWNDLHSLKQLGWA
jgi:ketosteroid isomerase-like protein